MASAPRRPDAAMRSRHLARAALVQRTVDETEPKQLSRRTLDLPLRLHALRFLVFLRRQLPRRLLSETAVIVRRQDLAGHRRRRLHHEPADLVSELGEHRGAVALGCFVRPDDNLFGGGDGLARLLRLDARGRGAGFLDQLLPLGVGFASGCPGAPPRSAPAPP